MEGAYFICVQLCVSVFMDTFDEQFERLIFTRNLGAIFQTYEANEKKRRMYL